MTLDEARKALPGWVVSQLEYDREVIAERCLLELGQDVGDECIMVGFEVDAQLSAAVSRLVFLCREIEAAEAAEKEAK